MADDINVALRSLSKQMGTITSEFVEMRSALTNIEDNICEISVKNGGGLRVTLKTKELLEKLYDHTKPGGIIDEKFLEMNQLRDLACATHKENFIQQINSIKSDDLTSKVGRFNKIVGTWGKGAFYVWMIAVSLWVLFKVVNFDRTVKAVESVSTGNSHNIDKVLTNQDTIKKDVK